MQLEESTWCDALSLGDPAIRLILCFFSTRLHLPYDWRQVEDESNLYYYNTESRQATWTHPLESLLKAFIRAVRGGAFESSNSHEMRQQFESCVETGDCEWVLSNQRVMFDLFFAYKQVQRDLFTGKHDSGSNQHVEQDSQDFRSCHTGPPSEPVREESISSKIYRDPSYSVKLNLEHIQVISSEPVLSDDYELTFGTPQLKRFL